MATRYAVSIPRSTQSLFTSFIWTFKHISFSEFPQICYRICLRVARSHIYGRYFESDASAATAATHRWQSTDRRAVENCKLQQPATIRGAKYDFGILLWPLASLSSRLTADGPKIVSVTSSNGKPALPVQRECLHHIWLPRNIVNLWSGQRLFWVGRWRRVSFRLNMDGDIAMKDKNVSQDEPEKTDVRGMTVSWFPVRKIR